MVNIDKDEWDIMIGQETLDNIAVASPVGGVNGNIWHYGFPFVFKFSDFTSP